MESETCDKHDDCLGRIHDSIKNIEIGIAETKGFTISLNSFTESIHRDVYSKGGIMERVGNHGNQLVLQWGLLAAIVIGIFFAVALKK